MDLSINPYSLTLIFSGLIVGIISTFITWKSTDSIKWLGFTMIAVSVWGFFYGIELSTSKLEEIIFWIKIEYAGLLTAPVFWVIFTLKYTGFELRKSRWIIPTLFIIPILTYIILLNESLFHLHYANYWLIETGPFPLIGIDKGPWYHIQTIFAYGCFLMGTVILIRGFRNANQHYRSLTKILIIGGIFPIALNILYQTSILKPFEGLDVTPFAFLFTYFFLAIAIINYQLLDLKPVARNKILELVTRGVIVLDKSQKIVDFNPAAKFLCGSPGLLKIGNSVQDLFSGKDEILNLLKGDSSENQEITVKIPEKETYYKIESVALLDQKGGITGYILLIDDLTKEILNNEKLKNQALELQKLNDLKDKLFSVISHDLKGPVLGVKELIHLTQTGLISQEEFLEILPEVSKNMEHVALLLENLLGWTSSQLRGEQIDKKELDLESILKSQKSLLERIAKEKNIQLELINPKPTKIKADKNMIELIFRNLISNAIKFSPQNSKVIIELIDEGENQVKVCVKDFGIGISEENLEKLNSGVSFTTRGQNNESGTGLGLVLVREYIFKNGGTLEITSKEGEGSKFCITLEKSLQNEASSLVQTQ
ncbi:signal transduction histidine kinase [Algoriphagus boseongensis]|uniref:histidine kinase n=1 Tax=Algoriphagus boseongensis TaxID=1442587 RepID=A0A4R6TAB2_9BACT|nr:histidine kinase N-terminal 7TM domain-containing protein [Algoriphagus boseongensis]TDQ18545.1 signal transduction histidine kinase [Algoriphagus boseongensis]